MGMSVVRGLLLYLFGGLLIWSCSESKNDIGQSVVSLSIPRELKSGELSAQAVTKLKYAKVVVSQNDSIEEELESDPCLSNCVSNTQQSFDFILNAGTYKFQVFAYYIDPNDHEIKSYYVEKDEAIAGGGSQNVSMQLENIDSNDLEVSLLGGRFLTGTDSGPTEAVEIFYHPSSGAPSFKIGQSSILNGYFKFLIHPGAVQTFALQDGTKLFDKVSAESLDQTLGSQVMRVNFPSFYVFSDKDGVITEEARWEQPANIYMGYFGTGVSDKRACYEDTTVGELIVSSDGVTSEMFFDSQRSTAIDWTGTDVFEDSVSVTSGVPESNDPICNANPSPHPDQITVRPSYFSYGGMRGIYGFEGAFGMIHESDLPQGFVKFKWEDSTKRLSLSWEYIPGIQSGTNGIEGVSVFRSQNFESLAPESIIDFDVCGAIQNSTDTRGFQLMTNGSYPNGLVTGTEFAIDGYESASFGKDEFVICPYRTVTDTSTSADGTSGSSIEYFSTSVDMGFRNSQSELTSGCTDSCTGFAMPGRNVEIVSASDSAAFLSASILALIYSDGTVVDSGDADLGIGSGIFESGAFEGQTPTANWVALTSSSLLVKNGDLSNAVQLPNYIISIAHKIDTSQVYGVTSDGAILKIDSSNGSTSSCDLSVCSIPVWVKSISIDHEGKVYGLDHGGNHYEINSATSVASTSVGPFSAYVEQVLYQ